MTQALVRPFAEIGLADLPQVGGKNASLGELLRGLGAAGIPVPDGFATTAAAYRCFLHAAGLEAPIAAQLAGLAADDVADLARRAGEIRRSILAAELPPALVAAIREGYRALAQRCGAETVAVAVRSSATAEDLPEASFAGQQETWLNVRGETELLDACRRCYASLFTDRAVAYRARHGFDHLQVALSVGVQRMVRADLGAAGVLFTLDTESGCRDVVVIDAAWGLGENVVRGVVTPDAFCVHKPTLLRGFRPIVERRLGSKQLKMVYDSRGGTQKTRNVPVPAVDRERFCLADDEVLQLARWGVAIEEHYSRHHGRPTPMDVEWAKDGETGELFVLQARPETVQSRRDPATLRVYRLGARPEPLVTGQAVGSRVGRGTARRLRDLADMGSLAQGDVLVTEMTDPDWVPVMKRAAAIVTERGGRTCHAAIVSRELGIPAVVGAEHALERIADGAPVSVSCAEGERGRVYPGLVEVHVEEVRVAELPPTRTRLLLNLADPGRAFELAQLPADGVGLLRMEFLVANALRVHPMALVRWPALVDLAAAEEIGRLTRGYADKREYFVDGLSQGIARIAAALWPRPVVLRLSDFKTNEYARLLGGAELEPHEENPMLGFRGAARYTHPRYRAGFALECAAIRRVREVMGLANLHVMVPFCRTPEEGEGVLAAMAEEGLVRGRDGLEVWVMCEIPSNVLLADRFAASFDGFSIGSNDLTQLVLGVDRDSETVAPLFDERSPAVLWMLGEAIAAAHRAGRKVSICGQAPSDYPEIAAFLVGRGIDSLSLDPDVLVATRLRVAALEAGTAAPAAGAGEPGARLEATTAAGR